ncbi:serine carboxypeptidase [Fomitopsis serialis]|uniref:serine carboxypeptidase n=1 Tax=Fomitopsis serialis TaxID=139415 RepID=UPI0020081643|nr:serine carboxypeptidase [Neoantrodia serialis]KAH9934969.1 serine carboxypeptidase [Neoantrodia serialis]
MPRWGQTTSILSAAMLSSRISALLATVAIVASAAQFPVVQPKLQARNAPSVGLGADQYNAGLLTPLRNLSALSIDEFMTFCHPLFPNYNVRIKKSDFCDGTVGAYTGYIDIQARHISFYFFESRNDPAKDDVILWADGGPGCSSALGLFMQLGPCRITNLDNLTFNPYSWNNKANIFFIDQPIGVGFSYAEYGETVSTTPEAAQDIAAFVAIFFEHFEQFKGRAFHMAGESYGGRYIPVFAAEIYDQNTKLVEAGLTPVNLSSIMIGNGCTDWVSMIPSYYDMTCTAVSVAPIMDISSCVRMKQAIPRCRDALQKSCIEQSDRLSCDAAKLFCSAEIDGPFFETGYNPYDISKPCYGSVDETLCYPSTKAIGAYLDRPDVRKQIGVDAFVGTNFSICNDEVHAAFDLANDRMFPTQFYISALLERGVRALIYVGVNDWACNWVGNNRMLLDLEWSGQEAFVKEPLKEWTVNGIAAGLTRSAGPLTFATIYDAGHMAPYDKPAELLELIKRWLAVEEL